ncbi:hypothetical protein HWI79_3176 [Cryptosporidium felis]|nr:hypothetical protein HWI79_3176 [Cryptosporidium felis]
MIEAGIKKEEMLLVLRDEQNSIHNLSKANELYEEIHRKVLEEKEAGRKLVDQIGGYLDVQKGVQEKNKKEAEEKHSKLVKGREERNEKCKSELVDIEEEVRKKDVEIGKMEIMVKDVAKANESMSQKIKSWEEKKLEWKRVVGEQERKRKQLSDLGNYLSERFAELNLEYSQIVEEKRELIASKENLESLVEKSKREAEENIQELATVEKQLKGELEEKTKENKELGVEIEKLRSSVESGEENKRSVAGQIACMEREFASKLKEIISNKELLLRMSEELDQRKVEASEQARELVQQRKSLAQIGEIKTSLAGLRERLRLTDESGETGSSYNKLVELQHVEEANSQLENEISKLSSKIKRDKETIASQIRQVPGATENISLAGVEKLLLEFENASSGGDVQMEGGVIQTRATDHKISNEEILGQILTIKSALGDGFESPLRSGAKTRRGRLKRDKSKSTHKMQQVLIQSLRLLQKVDEARAESTQNGQSSASRETPCASEEKGSPRRDPETSPSSRGSGPGRRVMIANRRLLTPRKGLFAPIPQSTRQRGSRHGDDDTLFGSDL